MYSPKFTINNEILANIGLIEAAREVIENAPLIPLYEARFVKDAILRTVHHGTHLEGNDLTLNEVKKTIEGERIVARERDIQEVLNYRQVLSYIEEQGKEHLSRKKYSESLLKKIHELTCRRILSEDQVGHFRQTQVVLKNSFTGEVTFRPPAALEVPFLMEDFFDWLNSSESLKIHPVLRAGITHYYLVAVHPFVEGNGRAARAFATLVLFMEDYDIKKFFSLEEYFDKDAASYFQALIEVSSESEELPQRDLTPWLNYFTQAMAVELTRIKEKIKRISTDLKIKHRVGTQIALNERQIKLMEYLQANGAITTPEARKILPEYSDDTLVRDFNYLAKKGILKKEGKTKAARYVLK
ncbi:Fic family protein [Candidatus Shapirobacteria bacterium]|nr:Fic family protein [Candidatus Shapirobacteria bacterium]